MKARLIRLHPDDNVVVATGTIPKGTVVKLERVRLTAASNLRMGHKVAVRPIAEGEKVLKYGRPIGVATMNVEPGQWVHVHNMRSLYITTREQRGADPSQTEASEGVGPAAASATYIEEEAKVVSDPTSGDASSLSE
ncbi:MAG: UxaA family hydrolase [Thermogutta sp.]